MAAFVSNQLQPLKAITHNLPAAVTESEDFRESEFEAFGRGQVEVVHEGGVAFLSAGRASALRMAAFVSNQLQPLKAITHNLPAAVTEPAVALIGQVSPPQTGCANLLPGYAVPILGRLGQLWSERRTSSLLRRTSSLNSRVASRC
jgi:hypothetical protein